jgi:hypothetical protein
MARPENAGHGDALFIDGRRLIEDARRSTSSTRLEPNPEQKCLTQTKKRLTLAENIL